MRSVFLKSGFSPLLFDLLNSACGITYRWGLAIFIPELVLDLRAPLCSKVIYNVSYLPVSVCLSVCSPCFASKLKSSLLVSVLGMSIDLIPASFSFLLPVSSSQFLTLGQSLGGICISIP